MNKIWIFIILISIAFGIINNRVEEMVEALFDVPEETLKSLLKIGSMLIIYNGIFKIAQDSNTIKKMSGILKKPINYIFKIDDEECKEFIGASMIANMLGLGPANMAIALKVIEKMSYFKKNKFYNLTMYLLINISSLCILPLSTLTFRATFFAKINIAFIPLLFIASLLTTIFAIFLVKVSKFNE